YHHCGNKKVFGGTGYVHRSSLTFSDSGCCCHKLEAPRTSKPDVIDRMFSPCRACRPVLTHSRPTSANKVIAAASHHFFNERGKLPPY
ncbi:hypothetical protein BaRGS_00028071, partial [Batillaria attramentaria]